MNLQCLPHGNRFTVCRNTTNRCCFPKCAPYKLPCSDTKHLITSGTLSKISRLLQSLNLSYFFRIKFFESYIALQDFKLSLGRNRCGVESNHAVAVCSRLTICLRTILTVPLGLPEGKAPCLPFPITQQQTKLKQGIWRAAYPLICYFRSHARTC